MVFQYTKNGRDFLIKSVYEKEAICDQYEPIGVFGAGFEFLEMRYREKAGRKHSWVCRDLGAGQTHE